jgi:hypothetical protein
MNTFTKTLLLAGTLLAITAKSQTPAALDFDGINDYVNTPVVISSASFPNVTFECWVKSPASPVQGTAYNGPMYSDNFGIIWDHGSLSYLASAAVGAANGNFYSASFGSLSPNTWYHLAASYDGTTLKSFKNGTEVSSVVTSGGLLNTTTNLKLGKHPSFTQFFTGSIDEARIWNKTLTCSQLRASMASQISGPQAGLVACYHFDDGAPNAANTSISTVADASGNNNTATLTGMALTGNSSNFVSSGPFNAAVNITPTLTATLYNTTLCIGSTLGLFLTGAGSYTWSSGETVSAISISPTVSTVYTVTGLNENCGNPLTSTISISVVVSTCTAGFNEKHLDSGLEVYPNPAAGYVYVKTGSTATANLITICDMTGRVLLQQMPHENDPGKINVSDLKSGVYQILLLENNRRYTGRLIIE